MTEQLREYLRATQHIRERLKQEAFTQQSSSRNSIHNQERTENRAKQTLYYSRNPLDNPTSALSLHSRPPKPRRKVKITALATAPLSPYSSRPTIPPTPHNRTMQSPLKLFCKQPRPHYITRLRAIYTKSLKLIKLR